MHRMCLESGVKALKSKEGLHPMPFARQVHNF